MPIRDEAGGAQGCHWYDNGQVALSGPHLRLFHEFERVFLSWASHYGAEEYLFPPFLPARELAKVDYFRSFPHLATFPLSLEPSADNLRRFTSGEPCDPAGHVRLSECSPVQDVLTPSPCYHFYVLFQGQELPATRFLTTRMHAFRREEGYTPLERQWSFSMREIVCIGTASEVQDFLGWMRDTSARFMQRLGIPVEWKNATDPFFDPTKNARFIAQKIAPLKAEMLFENRLALSSINFHRTYFGEAFGMTRGGEPLFSGCIGFGLERWMRAFLTCFGGDERKWPLPLSAGHEPLTRQGE